MLGKSNCFRLLAAAGLAGMAGFAPAQAQTIDFEAPIYVADKTMADVDGWTKPTDLPIGSTENFKILSASANKFTRSLTNGTGSIYRAFPDRGGVLDLRWRWRANGDSVHLCFGAEGNGGSLKISARAVACLDPSGGFEAQGLNTVGVSETWLKQTWYYMRMVMDPSLNKYTLYIANDSLRTDERVAVTTSTMNGVGPLGRVLIRNENGSGAVDLDDISWEASSIWLGESDSNWTTGKNWSAGAVPDSLTHVIFNETSAKSCYLDKNGTVKSITMASPWKGTLNLGGSVLNVLGKADFTGGSYAGQPAGFVRLLNPKAQSVIGAESGRPAPPLRHEGAGLLRLDVRALFGSSLVQAQGRFDFNGFDVYLNGDLTVRNGQPNTFLNLDGRAIAVGHSARLDGTSKDTLLGLASSVVGGGTLKGWSLTPSDTLIARFAVIGNSKVGSIATGYAFGSSDAGGNTGWVFAAPPAILAAPKDVNAKPGETATFRISVASKLPATYQWLRDDKDIPGAVDSGYTLGKLTLAGNGAAFSCRVTNAAGSATSAAARLVVTFPAPTPIPGPQEFADSLKVLLSPSVPGAKIYCSKNGAAFLEAAGAFMLTDSTTLRAYAVLGADTSAVGTWNYPKHQLPQVETPLLSPESMTFIDSQLVTLTPVTDGSSIHYTLDHSDPDSIKGLYAGPFMVKTTTVVSARAFKAGYRASKIVTNIYVRKGQDTSTLARPHATPAGGTFTDSMLVTLTPPDTALDATLYYTFAGGGLLKYYAPFNVRGTGTLKVIASKGSLISDTAFFAFTRRLEAPTATPKSRSFPDTLRIALTPKAPGESIFYTWDGTDPSGAKAKPYGGTPILLDSSATLKAISVKGQDTSAVLSETYTLIADTPQVSYRGGDYSSKIQLQLQASTPRAVIYYTLDGTTPGPENGRQPYTSAFSLDTTATLKAVAITGHGATLQRSPLLVENYTFIVPGRRILNPGQRLDLSSNYSLTSPLTGASQVIVDVLKVDSLNAIKGFRDIQFAIRLSLPEGSSAFPIVTFAAPNGEPRSLYGLVPPSTVTYITDADSRDITAPGTYFLAVDTLAPQITLSGETFAADDSTRAVFTVQDNVSNLVLDLERTDIPARNISGKAIGSPEIVTAVLRNPAGSIQPLTIRISVDDHHQKASYPAEPGAYHFLAQKASGPVRTPAVFKIGSDPANLWDFISLPLAVDPPLTLTQLRKNNAAPGLEAALWDQASGKYRFLADDERMTPGAALWMAAPASMASMTFPTLATSPRMETGTYHLTLHKGWNQVANPTLATMYWPVSRMLPDIYDQSPLKGLHGYDALTRQYVLSDSLSPWRGYFAYYKGGRDTVIELRFQPLPAAAPKLAGGKAAAATGLSLTFNLDGLPALRLGASAQAQDGIGYEDEPRPPSQNDRGQNDGQNDQGAQVWSARAGSRLETDVMHWSPGALYAWRVVAGVTATTGASTGSLRLPEGYAAWAVSRQRGLRFPLREGEALPLAPGFTDSLDVYAGPAAELDARLAPIPMSVDAFRLTVSSAPGTFSFSLRLPQAARIHWTLWSIDGRIRDAGNINLPEGIYAMVRGASGSGFPSGMYVLSLDWAGQPALAGRLTRKIAIP